MSGLLTALLLIVAFTSCSTPREISYFQDLQRGGKLEATTLMTVRIKPEDKISIIVKSKDPQLSALFNQPIVSYHVGQGKQSSLTGSQILSYTVDSNGDIDFPVLGKIHVEGMLREEIAACVKDKLMASDLVKDPVVTVDFDNLKYSVIGEVNNPGQFSIDRDKVTILDAISKAGDLTIYGKRSNVVVLRHENGQLSTYKMNLCSGADVLSSPAYYLQQDDVVYVEPNKTRVRQSTVNGNNVRSASFLLSLASFLTSIGILVFN